MKSVLNALRLPWVWFSMALVLIFAIYDVSSRVYISMPSAQDVVRTSELQALSLAGVGELTVSMRGWQGESAAGNSSESEDSREPDSASATRLGDMLVRIHGTFVNLTAGQRVALIQTTTAGEKDVQLQRFQTGDMIGEFTVSQILNSKVVFVGPDETQYETSVFSWQPEFKPRAQPARRSRNEEDDWEF